MSDQTSEQVRILLERLNESSLRLWPDMVAAMRVQAIVGLVIGSVVLLVALVLSVLTWRRLGQDDDMAGMDAVGLGLVAAVCFVVGTLALAFCLPGVLYPEATTVMRLISR